MHQVLNNHLKPTGLCKMDHLDRLRGLQRVLRRRNQHKIPILHERRGRSQRRMPRRGHGSFGLQRQRVPDVVSVVSGRIVLRVVRRRSAEEDEDLY